MTNKLASIVAISLLLGSACSALAQNTIVPSNAQNELLSKAPRLMGDQKVYGELRKKVGTPFDSNRNADTN
jgi:hypothetical protein